MLATGAVSLRQFRLFTLACLRRGLLELTAKANAECYYGDVLKLTNCFVISFIC